MPQPKVVRVPDALYESLRRIRHSLEPRYQSATPAIQDMVNVALQQFIKDWENSGKQSKLLSDLLEHRKLARERMGGKKMTDL
ncbi:hypothetical protein [Leptolyngbya sp. FACHB-261]|uniref:hypothetical protein n=1 Tax=Leptolyngbya sp. FACHB-261 TaxID=2692806 RepID=UPI0016896314|nr:hypothetical protein [Leptolyngbya sp. FACHB-261]MBD2101022.1 hypothetical protein [Leptolyngbya sp. FACHB-261]